MTDTEEIASLLKQLAQLGAERCTVVNGELSAQCIKRPRHEMPHLCETGDPRHPWREWIVVSGAVRRFYHPDVAHPPLGKNWWSDEADD